MRKFSSAEWWEVWENEGMTTLAIRTGTAHETPNSRIKSTSASFGIVTSTLLVNGTVTVEAWDHNNGRRVHIDFGNPYQTVTPASVQAERMRQLAETLLREAERVERLVARQV